MNEKTGTSVSDSSPNSNTGTFVNDPQWSTTGVPDSDFDMAVMAIIAENWLCSDD